MALTKISTGGVKDDGITSAKIADGNVQQGHLDSECVNESKIQISNAGTNGQFLQKQSGNAGGLTWAAAGGASSIADDSVTEVKLDIHADPSGTDKFLAYTSNGMEWAVPTDTNTQLSTEQVQDIVGAMFTGNTETNITVTYEDSDGTIDLVSTNTQVGGATGVDFNDDVKARFGTGNDLQIFHDGSNSYIKDLGDGSVITASDSWIYWKAESADENIIKGGYNSQVELYHSGDKRIETTAAGVTVTGTVTDSKGDVRSIPANAKTAAYTLVASDAGKFIPNTTGGWTIPNSVMSTGDAVTLINDSGSDQTITQGTNHTIYNTADGSTGTRTLAARGIATLIWQNSSVSYISGAGLS